ncbi:MAG TPA: P-loop NTPase fold protein, partial [Ktedonobacterales bacterium]
VARTFVDPVGSLASLARSSSISAAKDVFLRNRSTPEEQQAQLFDKVDEIKKQMTGLVNQILKAAKKAAEVANRAATKGAPDTRDWKLVMFIDDLDRCSPDNMVHLFEWLKVHLLVDNITYVLALDHTAAARAIVGHYKEYLGDDKDLDYGFRYLEKLVDTEYELELGRDVENMALSQIFIPAPGQSLPPKLSDLARLMAKGDFPGIVFIDELTSLRSLRIPRTMLKIVYKFSRALQTIEADTKEAAALRSRLPSSYPFWLILICAMYYRLDPDDVAEFTKHQGKIYEALTQENAEEDKNWHEGPQRDFFGFARRLRAANLPPPSSETLLELARVIRENTTDLGPDVR